MKLKKITLLIFCLTFTLNLMAQTPIEGIWKGTSICQIKNSSCYDEQVVYHISKDTGLNNFLVVAYKIVGGKEDNMGTLHFVYDAQKETFICADKAGAVRWGFQKKDGLMSWPVVIGYLHLMFLGVISLFIIGFCKLNQFIITRKVGNTGILIFVAGIILNQILLMIQGLSYMNYISVPYINELLFGAAICMFFGVFVIILQSRKKNGIYV